MLRSARSGAAGLLELPPGDLAVVSIGVGIVGFGEMALWHAEQVRALDGLELRVVCDVTPARRELAERQYGCKTSEELEPLLADKDVGLVLIATPSHAHVQPVLAALAAGKHVVVEKPIARTESDARRMFDAAREAGRTLMAFQNRRFDSDFLTARRAVESGELGRIDDIRLIRWAYSRLMSTFGAKEYRPGWRADAAYGGGNLLDWGPHLFDQMLQLVPAPLENVFGDLRARRWSKEVEDQFLAVLRFRGGVVAVVEFAQAPLGELDVSWAISGSDAAFRYENNRGVFYSRNGDDQETLRRVEPAARDWPALWRNMRDVVRDGAEPIVRPPETLRLMRVLDAVRRSSETGQVVAVQDEYATDSATGG